MRLKANFPTVRVDEITLHQRDNAMIVATHGRSIWILDHIEPIQEYAAAQAAEAKLFTPPPFSMYRRPASDRNYEFWGDQTFFGENPPQAALVSWFLKQPAKDVKLKITDAAGKDVREISGQALANSNKAGMQAACWDLRVQPLPTPAAGGAGQGGPPSPAAATGGQATAGQAGGGGAGGGFGGAAAVNPFGAGCAGGGRGGGGGGFGGGGGNTGPFVLAGTYNVSLIVDGKTIETKPLKVMTDPQVSLTDVERKRMFDMAMEMHEYQRIATDVSTALRPLQTRTTELVKEIAAKTDVPADVKASFDTFNKELTALGPKFAAAAGGRGGFGGGGGAPGVPGAAGAPGAPGAAGAAGAPGTPATPATPPVVSILTRIGLAKNGLMGGMPPTGAATKAYADSKAEGPKAFADANALFAKAATLSTALAKYNLKLEAPKPVAVTGIAAPKK
jgi:hypothetical protein